MTLRGDWNYRTATYLSADNNPILRQPAYHMVNLSASFLTAGQGVRVTGGVTNLTNKAILMSGFADLQGSSIADGTYGRPREWRSEEHTSELQSLMRISYAVFCLKKKRINKTLAADIKCFTLKYTT